MLPRYACALLGSLLLIPAVHSACAEDSPKPVLWNALATAPNGAWGVGQGVAQGEAIQKAHTSCLRRTGNVIGCGYQSKVIRGGWLVLTRCGRENIIGAAADRMTAEQQILLRLVELREDYGRRTGECERIAVVDSEGAVEAAGNGS
jgi:hypothetical protein